MKIPLVFCILVTVTLARDYSGYKTIRITPTSQNDLNILKDFEIGFKTLLDFWQSTTTLERTVDVLVPSVLVNDVMDFLNANGLQFRVGIEDMQKLIDSQAQERKLAVSTSTTFDYNIFHTYEEIRAWTYAFASEHPDLIEVSDVSWSYEDRVIALMKIGKPKGDGSPKKAVYYQGGIHAREWLSPATVISIVKYMVEDYGVNPSITALLDTFDYYIVPLFNVDGYAYTWSQDRLWRKNRHPFPDETCDGVDLNRNYPVGWGGSGARGFVCSFVYYGEGPFSEMEHQYLSQYLYDLINNQGVEFVHFIDFHTYSQLLLSPWSYSATIPDPVDVDDQVETGLAACESLEAVDGCIYTVGPTGKVLYEAAGSSNDWGYDVNDGLNAKYSYVMELRDTGEYGFVIPDSFIDVSGRETYEAVKVFAQTILAEYGNP